MARRARRRGSALVLTVLALIIATAAAITVAGTMAAWIVVALAAGFWGGHASAAFQIRARRARQAARRRL